MLILCQRDDCTEFAKQEFQNCCLWNTESVNDLVAKVGPFKSLHVCFVLEKISWGNFVMYYLILSSVSRVWFSGRENMLLFGISLVFYV